MLQVRQCCPSSHDMNTRMCCLLQSGVTSSSGMTAPEAFRHALEVLLLKSYSACRDNIKRHLSLLLPNCIQAPQMAHTHSHVSGRRAGAHMHGSFTLPCH